MASVINNPPVNDGNIPQPWYDWIYQAFRLLFALQQSGTTAQRPTVNLWIGRTYYDTTLGKPIWVNAVKPTIWKDASGAVV